MNSDIEASGKPESLEVSDAKEIDENSEVANKPLQNDVPVLRRAAMDYLARREHSLYELQQKLITKFPDTDSSILSCVLNKLKTENLQSDDRFAEAYVRYRKTRGFGSQHIRADLLSRKVGEELVNQYVFDDDSDWLDITKKQVEKKLRRHESLQFGSKIHRRLLRFLKSRGFTPSNIQIAVKSYLS